MRERIFALLLVTLVAGCTFERPPAPPVVAQPTVTSVPRATATRIPTPTGIPTARPTVVAVALPAVTRVALPTRPSGAEPTSPDNGEPTATLPGEADPTAEVADGGGDSVGNVVPADVSPTVLRPVEDGTQVMGEVTNSSSDTIVEVEIICTLVDQAGNDVASQPAFSHLHTLGPGQKTPFAAFVGSDVLGWQRVRVEIRGVPAVGSTAAWRTLDTSDLRVRVPANASQLLKIEGQVENNGTVVIESPTVILAVFDNTGLLIAVHAQSAGVDNPVSRIDPGDRAPFMISIPETFRVPNYYVLAEGVVAR